MALTKAQKTAQLNELKDKMQKSTSVMFAHYIGLTVHDVSDLRDKLRAADSEMKVAKKTLMQIAAKDLGMPEIPESAMDGAVACIFSFVDPLTGAQIAFKFAKDHPQVELIGGIFEGKLISKEQAIAIAKIPSKLQLLGMFASMCNSPLSSFARGLSEIAKQKEAPSSAKATDGKPAAVPEATVEVATSAPTEPAAPVAEAPQTEAPASAEATADKPAA
jgi:large subunit ribosomal protein L10